VLELSSRGWRGVVMTPRCVADIECLRRRDRPVTTNHEEVIGASIRNSGGATPALQPNDGTPPYAETGSLRRRGPRRLVFLGRATNVEIRTGRASDDNGDMRSVLLFRLCFEDEVPPSPSRRGAGRRKRRHDDARGR
jgi:hypothetical protein